MTGFFNQLFIFEMANNHMGDLKHGLRIIDEFSTVAKKFPFQFGIKLQYRHLDTFIHPDYKNRSDIKYVKRFQETRLTPAEFKTLKDAVKSAGLLAICTPFDEISADLAVEHNFDIIKIASCSLTDWPLLEHIVKINKPIIFSTGGSNLNDIDKVVSFFQHREKEICLMHCIGEYPTQNEHLQMNQIDLFKNRYVNLPVGFSTHEQPDNFTAVKIAVAKGAVAFERHVGIKTDQYAINAYSSEPAQIENWLKSALDAFTMCGVNGRRYEISEKEIKDLNGLKRGVFIKTMAKKGEKIAADNSFFAIPCSDGQLLANDLSKYIEYTVKEEIKANQSVLINNLIINDQREQVLEIVKQIIRILKESHIFLPNRLDLELSHHYGIGRFNQFGAAIVSCINREYCKKLIILLPGQKNPLHHHLKKEETFHVLHGNLMVEFEDHEKEYKTGEMIVVERGVKHGFYSPNGCIFEEISTTHFVEDSFYLDQQIMENKSRKTVLTFWSDWLTKQEL